MNNLSFSKMKARMVIDDYNLVYPLDVYKFCKLLDIEIIEKPLNGQAYFIRKQDIKLIFLSTYITNMHHRKFCIAHELGHYFIHDKELMQIDNYISESYAWRNNVQKCELEANEFAGEVILPDSEVRKHLSNGNINFNLIKMIAQKYDNSITSTAIKCVENSNTENETLICYKKSKLMWFTTSNRSFNSRKIPIKVPEGSLAYEFYSSGKLGESPYPNTRGIWMEDEIVTEEIFPISAGMLLVLLCQV